MQSWQHNMRVRKAYLGWKNNNLEECCQWQGREWSMLHKPGKNNDKYLMGHKDNLCILDMKPFCTFWHRHHFAHFGMTNVHNVQTVSAFLTRCHFAQMEWNGVYLIVWLSTFELLRSPGWSQRMTCARFDWPVVIMNNKLFHGKGTKGNKCIRQCWETILQETKKKPWMILSFLHRMAVLPVCASGKTNSAIYHYRSLYTTICDLCCNTCDNSIMASITLPPYL